MKSLIRPGVSFILVSQLSSSEYSQSGIITTYVGPGMPIDGTLATTQPIDHPFSVALLRS